MTVRGWGGQDEQVEDRGLEAVQLFWMIFSWELCFYQSPSDLNNTKIEPKDEFSAY